MEVTHKDMSTAEEFQEFIVTKQGNTDFRDSLTHTVKNSFWEVE